MSDGELVQIVDRAMAESVRRSGEWLQCKPGCTQCCYGPFEITRLDAARLREGLARLDEAMAGRIRERARAYVELEDAACPALDPETGTCDLYSARPLTCRMFGPPAKSEDGSYSVCELCFEGASNEQIAACWVDPDPEGVEARLLDGDPGLTSVAAALIGF